MKWRYVLPVAIIAAMLGSAASLVDAGSRSSQNIECRSAQKELGAVIRKVFATEKELGCDFRRALAALADRQADLIRRCGRELGYNDLEGHRQAEQYNSGAVAMRQLRCGLPPLL